MFEFYYKATISDAYYMLPFFRILVRKNSARTDKLPVDDREFTAIDSFN